VLLLLLKLLLLLQLQLLLTMTLTGLLVVGPGMMLWEDRYKK